MNTQDKEEVKPSVCTENGTYSRLITLGESAEESADEGPIETLENPNTLEEAVNLQVQENLKKLRKFYGIDCVRKDRRISISKYFTVQMHFDKTTCSLQEIK